VPATAARWARRELDGRRQAVEKPHGDQSGDHPEDDAGTAALRAHVNVIQERPHKQNIPEPRPIYSPWGRPASGRLQSRRRAATPCLADSTILSPGV